MNRLEVVGQAKDWAYDLHGDQKRKGKDVPYIVHPARVVELLEEVNADEDVRAAGWLHDVVEDQNVSIHEIRLRFGYRVAAIVSDVTEPDKSLPWEVRKRQAEEHIPQMGEDSLLVKTADVIANTEEMIEDYKRIGDEMFKVFNGAKDAQLEHRKNLLAAITLAWPENPLLPDLELAYTQFEEVIH